MHFFLHAYVILDFLIHLVTREGFFLQIISVTQNLTLTLNPIKHTLSTRNKTLFMNPTRYNSTNQSWKCLQDCTTYNSSPLCSVFTEMDLNYLARKFTFFPSPTWSTGTRSIQSITGPSIKTLAGNVTAKTPCATGTVY